EEAINGVENMMYMKSVAGSDGVLVTTVTFRPGPAPDQAQVQVQNRVAQDFALFKNKRMAIFFIFSMMLGAELQITNMFG
ncbi:efflux RND transporter permease subunit, partial [Escherichia coli]|nr:efflux RND transporter permease subunit [Escherichia coli]